MCSSSLRLSMRHWPRPPSRIIRRSPVRTNAYARALLIESTSFTSSSVMNRPSRTLASLGIPGSSPSGCGELGDQADAVDTCQCLGGVEAHIDCGSLGFRLAHERLNLMEISRAFVCLGREPVTQRMCAPAPRKRLVDQLTDSYRLDVSVGIAPLGGGRAKDSPATRRRTAGMWPPRQP